ncbi:AzlD domain-containing protein [Vagococcus salmoninarum]|uniref:AzlD domain-containing protein n=1 Tax=Vagococcus salmoninarum TaxID=2739 RepID=UPI0028D63064|nr:AzlD domain-containing protein [Vagococcus salmoninarum]
MRIDSQILVIIMLCGLVTWLPRILPFILSKKTEFPKKVNQFLAYLPMCILTALFLQGLFIPRGNSLPSINWETLFASVPTLLIGVLTKNLMWTVIVGIISMAALRFFM